MEEEGNSTYYIPVVLGVVMMVALALVTLAVLLRYTKHCYQMTNIYRHDWLACVAKARNTWVIAYWTWY